MVSIKPRALQDRFGPTRVRSDPPRLREAVLGWKRVVTLGVACVIAATASCSSSASGPASEQALEAVFGGMPKQETDCVLAEFGPDLDMGALIAAPRDSDSANLKRFSTAVHSCVDADLATTVLASRSGADPADVQCRDLNVSEDECLLLFGVAAVFATDELSPSSAQCLAELMEPFVLVDEGRLYRLEPHQQAELIAEQVEALRDSSGAIGESCLDLEADVSGGP